MPSRLKSIAPLADARRHGLLIACLLFAAPASASYGNMRLEGLSFLLAIALLCGWSLLLTFALALGAGTSLRFVAPSTTITVVLTTLLLASFDDGARTMQARPLGSGAVFVILLLLAVPVLLAAPIVKMRRHARGESSALPTVILSIAIALVPIGSTCHGLLQTRFEQRTLAATLALEPGGVLTHVIASRRRAADSWLDPYLWTEGSELMWISIGVGQLPFVDRSAPLSTDDARGLSMLIATSVGTLAENYTWKLEAKLFWDRLSVAAPGEKVAIAHALTESQASHFAETIGIPHPEWLCGPLAELEMSKALRHASSLLSEPDRARFMAAVRGACRGTIVDRPAPAGTTGGP